MAIDKRLQIFDDEGNPVDYDIMATDVKFNDGKDLPTKLAEMEEEIGEGGYTPPQDGIPKTDLAPAVQTSLDKADSAYQKPANGIPASDLASGVIPDVSGFATKTEVNAKANSADVYTKQQTDAKIAEAAIDAVVGNGDFAMTYDQASDTFNIVRLVPALQVTQLSSMSASTKSGTFKVSGTHLKGNVTIAISATGWTLSDGTNSGQTLTLSPVDGVLAETTITVTYSGSTDSVGNTITISSTNAESKTVTANYTVVAGPTIFADTSKTINAIAGGYATTTIEVTASQLTEGITVIKDGTNADKFTVTPSSLGTSGGTLNVQFSPNASDTANQSATITLRSAGADDVVINITGHVLVPSLSVNPASLGFDGQAGETTSAKQIVLTGANLLNDVTVTAPSGFTVTRSGSSVSSIAKEDVMAIGGVTLDVVAAGTTASGSLVFTSGNASTTASLTWQESEEETVGVVVSRPFGYSSVDDATPSVPIKFMISALPANGENGQVKVVDKLMESGGTYSSHAASYQNATSNANYSLAKVEVPESITINGNTYDVTELGEGCFAQIQTQYYIKFSNAGKLKKMSSYKNGNQFHDPTFRSNICGSGVGDFGIGSNTFVVPSGVTYWQCSSQNGELLNLGSQASVTKVVIPDSLVGGGSNNNIGYICNINKLTYFDFGTGITTMTGYLVFQNSRINTILFRYDGVVTPATTLVIDTWPSSAKAVKMYVPDSKIASYKADSTWANYIWDETNNPNGRIEILGLTSLNS